MEGKTNNNFRNQNKRIAMFAPHSDPLAHLGSQESGGQNIYIKSLTTELDKKGWSIDIFTRLDEAHKKSVSLLGKRSRVIRLKGGLAKYVPKNQLFDHFEELYSNFLNAIDHQNPYSLFHGHYWDGGWMALRAHREFGKPLIENFHSLGQVRFQTRKQFNINDKNTEVFDKRFALEKEIINETSVIISLSESEKNDLSVLYGADPEKIIVIPGGVNIKQCHEIPKEKAREILNLPKDRFIVLFLGRLEWRKGIGVLITAAKLLKNDVPNLNVIIVGGKIYGRQKNSKDFKEYQRLSEKAEQEGVKDIVNFVGRIGHDQIHIFYSAADVFVIPSYYEPFGLVALEGMACGIPVIASNVGGLKTTIEDQITGLLFQPRNPLDLKEKILLIYKLKEISEKLKKNAYDKIKENYSWQNIADQIEKVYQSLIYKNTSEQI